MKFFAFSVLILLTGYTIAEDWRLIKDIEGIKVYNKTLKGSDFNAFRVMATLDISQEKLIALFHDIPRQTEWMADCSESRLLAHSDSVTWKIYTVTSVPWPLKDRDAVWLRKASINQADGSYRLDFVALPDTIVPYKKERVRMIRAQGYWKFQPIHSLKTMVTYEFHGDPGGRLPKGLANLSSQSMPLKTIQGLRNSIKP